MDKEENKLYIPANCSPLDYVITGFTSKELVYIFAISTLAVIVSIFLFLNGQSILAVIFTSSVISFCIIFFRRDRYSENCIDKIILLLAYKKAIKQYHHEYKNIYEFNK